MGWINLDVVGVLHFLVLVHAEEKMMIEIFQFQAMWAGTKG